MVLFPEDLEIKVPDFFCFMWPLKECKGLASSHQSNSTKVNKATAAGKENVAKIALNWGSFFQKPWCLAFRGDLSFHLFVLGGNVHVVDRRQFTDCGGELGPCNQPLVCLHVLLTRD